MERTLRLILTFFILIFLNSCGVKESVEEGKKRSSQASTPQVFSVTGLSNSSIPVQTKIWSWGCYNPKGNPCEYRYAINTNPSFVFLSESFSPAPTTDALSAIDGTYYLHIQARDSVTLEETENPLTVQAILDNTAPTIPAGGSVLSNYTSNPAFSSLFSWSASSDTNGVDHYEVSLGTTVGATDIVSWTNISSVTTYRFSGLSLSDGVQYYPSVRAHDQAGNISNVHSNFGSFCSDTTAPTAPSGLNLAGTAYLVNSPTLSWSAVIDSCSGVAFYEVALGTTSGGSDVVNWTNVGTNLNYQFTTLSPELEIGQNYYMSVRATDAAGLVGPAASSSVFQIPSTLNVTGIATDLTPTKSKIWVWGCDSAPCNYRYVVNQNTTHDFNGESFGLVATDSILSGNGNYYLHVQAKTLTNSAVSPVLSVSVIIDNTAPTTPSSLSLSQAFTTSASQAPTITWGASNDLNGVVDYEVGLGTLVGGVNILPFTSDGNDLSSTISGLSLVEGLSYYATVRALDEAGNISATASTTSFCYDNTAPSSVTSISNGSDSLLSRTPTHTWVAATDSCSGINFYELAVGSSAGATDIASWTNIGNVTSYQLTGLSLSPNTNYYTSIRATDLAGFVSTVATSAAWQVDNPYITNISPPSDGTYSQNGNLDFVVTFSKNVVVTNSPRIAITLDSGLVYADYLSGSGTNSITFRYTVSSGHSDSNGIVLSSSIDLNSTGSIVDSLSSSEAILSFTPPSTTGILVDGVGPTITGISPPSNSTYGASENLDFTVNFTEAVTVVNNPRVIISLNSGTVYADYLSGSGSSSLIFRYTVNTNDEDNDGLTLTSPLDLNSSGTIKDSSGNNADLTFTPPTTSGVLVDALAPTILSITAPSDGTYTSGQNLDFVVNFSESITVTNTPRLQVELDSGTVYANYLSGNGTSSLTFRYTIQLGDSDVNGISLASPIDLNTTGVLADSATNSADLTFSPPSMSSVLVGGVGPNITSITIPTNGTYTENENLDFIINWNKVVTITGTPRIAITLDSGTVYADYFSGSGSATTVFRYSVAANDEDSSGIALTSPLDLNATGTIKDSSNNNASLSFSPPSTNAILVDAVIPTISSVSAPSNNTYTSGQNLDFTVTFSENVTVSNTPRMTITLSSGTVYANYLSGAGSSSLIFRYTVGASDEDSNGIVLVSPIDLNTIGVISDSAGNNSVLSFSPPSTSSILIGNPNPIITSISLPPDGDYATSDNLDIVVHFSEVVNVTGTPKLTLTFGSGSVSANYFAGTGTSSLTFRYTVQSSDADSDGIVLVSPLNTPGSIRIRDIDSNDAQETFTPPDSSGITINSAGGGASLQWDVSSHDYGQSNVNISQTFTVTNNGTATSNTLSVSIGGADTSKFEIDVINDNCSGLTLAVSASCSVDVIFKGGAGGAKRVYNATVDISDGASSSTITIQGEKI